MTRCYWRNHSVPSAQQDSPGFFTPDGCKINRSPVDNLSRIPLFLQQTFMASISRTVIKKVLSQETSEVLDFLILSSRTLNGNTLSVGCRRTRSPLDRLFTAAELDAFPHARPLPYWQGCRTSLHLSFCIHRRISMIVQGFPDHPHRGQATVTYMFEGASKHEDSAGHAGIIREGGVQWMCAVRALCSFLQRPNNTNHFYLPFHRDRAAEVSISNATEAHQTPLM